MSEAIALVDAPRDEAAYAWEARLLRSERSGTVLGTRANAMLILSGHPDCAGVLAFDVRSHKVMVMRRPPWAKVWDRRDFPAPWCEARDGDWGLEWLQHKYQANFRALDILPAMAAAAQVSRFDPVRKYLDGLEWDQERDRCEEWLINYCGAPDTVLTRAMSKRWLISAVARVYAPGCQADSVLVLEGKGGSGKSSLFRVLAVEAPWFKDEAIPLQNQRQAAGLVQGQWIHEIAEFASFRKADQALAKSFLTRRVDNYQPPYGRSFIERPRGLVFGATTNERQYLTDPTGLRRYWPCAVADHIDLDGLISVRDQLWAEAKWHYMASIMVPPREGVPGSGVFVDGAWWFAEAELQHLAAEAAEDRRDADAIEDVLDRWTADREDFTLAEAISVVSGQMMGGLLAVKSGDQGRVKDALIALGFEEFRKVLSDGRRGGRRWRLKQ